MSDIEWEEAWRRDGFCLHPSPEAIDVIWSDCASAASSPSFERWLAERCPSKDSLDEAVLQVQEMDEDDFVADASWTPGNDPHPEEGAMSDSDSEASADVRAGLPSGLGCASDDEFGSEGRRDQMAGPAYADAVITSSDSFKTALERWSEGTSRSQQSESPSGSEGRSPSFGSCAETGLRHEGLGGKRRGRVPRGGGGRSHSVTQIGEACKSEFPRGARTPSLGQPQPHHSHIHIGSSCSGVSNPETSVKFSATDR